MCEIIKNSVNKNTNFDSENKTSIVHHKGLQCIIQTMLEQKKGIINSCLL